jgi:glycosyltransferase involved in cell wall biosynthesis
MVQAEIPEVVFVLVGGIGDEIARLTRLKERYNLVDTVKLLPRKPREKIPDYLALADALVLPRISGENAPLKIYEYLKSKIPIVATKIPAHMTMLSDKTAIIVAPTPKDISRGILQVLQNKTSARKMAMAAHSFVLTYKLKSIREVISEAYGSLSEDHSD